MWAVGNAGISLKTIEIRAWIFGPLRACWLLYTTELSYYNDQFIAAMYWLHQFFEFRNIFEERSINNGGILEIQEEYLRRSPILLILTNHEDITGNIYVIHTFILLTTFFLISQFVAFQTEGPIEGQIDFLKLLSIVSIMFDCGYRLLCQICDCNRMHCGGLFQIWSPSGRIFVQKIARIMVFLTYCDEGYFTGSLNY